MPSLLIPGLVLLAAGLAMTACNRVSVGGQATPRLVGAGVTALGALLLALALLGGGR